MRFLTNIIRTLVLQTGGTYIIFDKSVSSAGLPTTVSLSDQLLSSIKYHQPVHSICLVPSIFEEIVKEISSNDLSMLQQMKCLYVGGAPTPEVLFKWAAENMIPLNDILGATEVAGLLGLRSALDPQMSTHGIQVGSGLEGFIEKEEEEDTYGELIVRGQVSILFLMEIWPFFYSQSKHLPRGYDHRDSTSFDYQSTTGVTTYRTGDIYTFSRLVSDQSLMYVHGQDIPTSDTSLRKQMKGM